MDHYLQAFFILTASTILLANNIPPLRETLIAYGPRSTSAEARPPKNPPPPSSNLKTIVGTVSTFRVPHAYFSHFYTLSTASSLFWAIQFLTNGSFHRICLGVVQSRATAGTNSSSGGGSSMSIEQVELAWLLLLLQGLRRQLETTLMTKPSQSKMWLGHYLLGLAFYLAMGIAIWIEGADTLLSSSPTSVSTLKFSAPSISTIILIPLIILASGIQHDAHHHLASLPKYTLPTHPIFELLLCPHYTAECVMYICLAVLTAPEGQWVNRTVGAGAVFVCVNLGVSATGARAWYEGRFGKEKVRERWVMVPGVW